jgi:phosphatidylglycerol:prolipoprotein diacylglycerol transferase
MNPINPIIFQLGPFQVRWYGVLIMTGVALGAYFATRLARKRGLDPDHVWGGLMVAVVMAIVGARLYHVFSTPADCPVDATFACGWPYYKHHFLEAFAVWKTGGFQGLGIYGAIVGGILGVTIYAWWNKLNPLVWLDLGAPGLAFGQFIGRWGNFINQELYGPPTGSSWYGIKINPNLPHQALPPGTDYNTRFHPTFLYESLWSLVVFIILYNVHARLRHRLRNGDVLLGYLILYPLGRFFVEFFRPDAWTIGGLATAQWIAIGLIVSASTALFLRHRFWNREAAENEGQAIEGQSDAVSSSMSS